MKKCLILLSCAALLGSGASFAAQPTTINYSGKGSTLTGNKYRLYTVRCSDGKQRDITSWNDSKQWCVGKASNSACSQSQLKAAAQACK